MRSLLIAALLISTSLKAQTYPLAKKITQTEVRFGVRIEDPYKWMENPSDPDLWDWIEEQKAHTAQHLDADLMDQFSKKILEIRKLQREQDKLLDSYAPVMLGASRPTPSVGEEHLIRSRFINWQQEGLTSPRLKSLVQESGPKTESTLYKIEVKAVHNGDLQRVAISQKSDNKLVDVLLVKFYTFIAWADENSFYYISDLDERIGGGRPALFRHIVGEVQSEDQLLVVAKTPASSLTIHKVGSRFFLETDGTIGSLQLSSGRITNIHSLNGEVLEMVERPETFAVVRSFVKADMGELIRLRMRDGERSTLLESQNFVAQTTRHLEEKGVLVIGLKDAANVAYFLNTKNVLKQLSLEDGTITFSKYQDGKVRLVHQTLGEPKALYSYTLATGELELLTKQNFSIELVQEKIYYTASTGQPASLYLLRKKGTELNTKTPTILFGYGGFEVSITPTYAIYECIPWLERGGVLAVATLPGSLDYGKSWYEVAKVGGRIHSWDSFALAAKELYNRGWTSAEHLGVLGASNGGTLVAGALQRHSEVFKAAVPIVGVMDLLNFTLFTAGKYWTDDYGNPFVEKDFRAIFPLSPYHNIERRQYPATMVMTAEFDDRVVPMHSYKYLSRLQEYNTSANPILLYNKEWGGHGRASGSDRESSRYVAAFYTFFAQQLGL